MEYSPHHRAYLIVAGSHASGGVSRLYRWSGTGQPEFLRDLPGINPESFLVFNHSPRLLFLSDDGTRLVKAKPGESTEPLVDGMCECKSLKDPNRKSFRAVWIEVPR